MSMLIIANTGIQQDDESRYSLKDLHKAALAHGVKKDIRPNEWLSLQGTQELAEILIAENPASKPIVSKPGRYGGTYVCKELVYDYAMWISPKFHLQVIRTFDAVATGHKQAAGGEFAQGAFKEFQVTRLELVRTVVDLTASSLELANLMGFEGNQGRFYADKVVRKQIGIGPLELLGVDSLPSSNDDVAYTVKQLGDRFAVSAQAFNKLLHKCGLQEPVPKGQGDLRWLPTEKGKPHAVIKDTFREHNSGAPVAQLRWKESVLDELRRASAELNLLLKPVTRG